MRAFEVLGFGVFRITTSAKASVTNQSITSAGTCEPPAALIRPTRSREWNHHGSDEAQPQFRSDTVPRPRPNHKYPIITVVPVGPHYDQTCMRSTHRRQASDVSQGSFRTTWISEGMALNKYGMLLGLSLSTAWHVGKGLDLATCFWPMAFDDIA